MQLIKLKGSDSSTEPEESSSSGLWWGAAISWPNYWTASEVRRRVTRNKAVSVYIVRPFCRFLIQSKSVCWISFSKPSLSRLIFKRLAHLFSLLIRLLYLYLQVVSARGQYIQTVSGAATKRVELKGFFGFIILKSAQILKALKSPLTFSFISGLTYCISEACCHWAHSSKPK